MITVRDYIESNDDIRVRIAKKESRDPYDPFAETIWEGMLSEIPEELRGLEVINEGWLLEGKVNQLEVIDRQICKEVEPWEDQRH